MVKLPEEEPIEKVVEMQKQGIPTDDIVKDLRAQGISYKDTEDAINQAELRPSIMEEMDQAPAPTPTSEAPPAETSAPQPIPIQQPQFIPQQPVRSEIENVEVLIENIVEEKWQRAMETYGDMAAWKEKVRTEIISIKQELLRIRNKLENTESAILGKVTKYDKDIVEMGSEVRALEKVLQNILKPLTTSIKDLQSVTKKLKK